MNNTDDEYDYDVQNRSHSYYRVVLLCWFTYLLIKCCCERRTRDAAPNGDFQRSQTTRASPDGMGGVIYLSTIAGRGGENAEDAAKRRLDLVRTRLEFRTITEESDADVDVDVDVDVDADAERDIEKGEESKPAASPLSANKETKSTTATASNDAENNDSASSANNNDNNNSSSSRSVRSLFSKMLSRRTSNENNNNSNNNDNDIENSSNIDNNDDEEDPQISANENTSFSIASLIQSMGLTSGTDTRSQECCSICLESYVPGDTVARLKKPDHPGHNHDNGNGNGNDITCKHWFHEDCILEWLQNHNDCPLCRVTMVGS